LPLGDLRLLAPIGEPRRNILCLGMNYAEHAAESLRAKGQPVVMPKVPVIFTKATTAVTGPYDDLHLDYGLTTEYDWEVELGFVIGKRGKNIPRAEALDYVFGFTVINDVSARDVQTAHGGQFFRGKSFDETCPMGPWVVTADEIADPHALTLRCMVNGALYGQRRGQARVDDGRLHLRYPGHDRMAVEGHDVASRRRDLDRHPERGRIRAHAGRVPQARRRRRLRGRGRGQDREPDRFRLSRADRSENEEALPQGRASSFDGHAGE